MAQDGTTLAYHEKIMFAQEGLEATATALNMS
jgi:hypothetical protein